MKKLCLLIALVASSVFAQEEDMRRSYIDLEDRAYKMQDAIQTFPGRRMSASTNPLPMPTADLPGDFEIHYEWEGESYGIEDFNERTNSNALLILKNGAIVKEIYRNGSEADTKFISWSTAKSFTSTMVGIAVEDGYIDSVEEALTNYLPALLGSAYEGVSIKNTLQMSSGVEWDESSYDFRDLSKPLAYQWENSIVQHRYRFIEGANSLLQSIQPGSKFNYSTMDSSILGWLVENSTGKRLASYMEERLWHPAGMEFDAVWLLDGPEEIGREMAGGMLAASLRDFGRYGLLMLNNGRSGERQVISENWVREATSADEEAVSYGALYEGYPLGYGYQWWLFPDGNFEAQGLFGQLLYIAPEENVVIVKLSAWPEGLVEEMEFESYAFFDAVVSTLKDF